MVWDTCNYEVEKGYIEATMMTVREGMELKTMNGCLRKVRKEIYNLEHS